MDKFHWLWVAEATSVLLFYLQALRVVFSVMFGIIYDQVFLGPISAWLFASNLLILLALLAPVFAPRIPRRVWLGLFVLLAALGRIALTINDAQARLWGALFVLAFGGLYLAGLLTVARPLALTSLILALGIDQLLRVAGQTYDVSLRPAWLPVQIAWGIGLIGLAIWLNRRDFAEQRAFGAPGVLWGLGLGAILYLEVSLLGLPNALARWSGWSYPLTALMLAAISFLSLLPAWHILLHRAVCQHRLARLAGGIGLGVALMIGYFPKGLSSALALLIGQVLVLSALICLLDSPAARLHSPGPRLALGLLFFLVLTFFNAFAFTYPYVLPFMRGLGWVVYVVAAVVLTIALFFQPVAAKVSLEAAIAPKWILAAVLGALVLTLGAVWPQTVEPLPDTGTLRVATYNIHYGYDTFWHFTLEEMAQTIEESGADVIALQEVDTGRLTSYGVDDAMYLARRLHMNVVYLPTVEHLTGIALLFRGEAEWTDGRLLTSLQEQTGIVHARLKAGQDRLDAYGTWLGLEDEDTQSQIREALGFIGDQTPTTFGGDFNAEPDSPVAEAVESAGFIDPFMALGIDPPPLTDPAIQPTKRIDYVWGRGLTPTQAWVPDSLASDHRMVVVEISLVP